MESMESFIDQNMQKKNFGMKDLKSLLLSEIIKNL